jgi:hypothetical protein
VYFWGAAAQIPDDKPAQISTTYPKIVQVTSYVGDGKVLDYNRYAVHYQVYENGCFRRDAVNHSYEEGTKEFTDKVNTSHLRVHRYKEVSKAPASGLG